MTSFIYHERIRTTVPRAKELRKMADNMVTLAKKGERVDYVAAIAVAPRLWSPLPPELSHSYDMTLCCSSSSSSSSSIQQQRIAERKSCVHLS